MTPKALIFDLDGVLTDTAKYHFLAWKALCDKHGFHFTETDNQRLKGVSRRRSLEIILEINEALDRFSEEELSAMETEKNKLYVQFVSTMTPADILPGIADFLKQAKAAGLKTAVASASRNAFTVLDCLQLRSCFDYVANAAEITRTKPDPEVFLNCAAALGLPPQECIGLEDAQAGIEAINAAGMFSVGIGVQVVTREPDLAFARVEELSLDAILSAAAR